MKQLRQPKVSRPLTLLAAVLIGFSQLGCAGGAAPVAAVLKNVIFWVGKRAAETALFVGVEKLIDRLFGQHGSAPEMEVVVDPVNPLRGRGKGPVTLQNADDPSKSFLLVDFPVRRDALNAKWKPDPEYVQRIERSLKGK